MTELSPRDRLPRPGRFFAGSRAAARPRGSAEAGPDCLIEKFRNLGALSPAEVDFLSGMQVDERVVPLGQDIIVQGRPADQVHVLKRGWAYSYKVLPDGKRQVLEFLLPGDFLGVREFAFDDALNYVVACTQAVVCPFPRSRLDELIGTYPNLARMLMRISTREQAILVERIVNIGSRTAYQRVAHLFLELLVRLRAVRLGDHAAFPFPISQATLADALGLSAVHVNRTLKKLRERGLLDLTRNRVTILDLQGLIAAAQFEAHYLDESQLRPPKGAKLRI